MARCEPGISAWISSENSGGQIQSSRPARIRVGAVMRASSGRRSKSRRKPSGLKARFSASGLWMARARPSSDFAGSCFAA